MRVLDLFSGIGGFSLGLERAGMTTVAFCEIDPKARQVLKKHWPDVPIYEDVSNFNGSDVQNVDIICGGFPCQDISLAGKGAGLAGERSGLWFQFHRLIKEIKPKYAIIENVSALRSRGLDQVLRSLAEIGYDAEWHCIPASAVGAPHRRDRIWIVAHPHNHGRDGSENPQSNHKRNDGNSCRSNISGEFERSGYVGSYIRRNSPQIMADPYHTRLQGNERKREAREERESGRHTPECSRWPAEPDVGRVANGIPGRVDRLKQLGNAVVPQIPELIGLAIMELEKCNSPS